MEEKRGRKEVELPPPHVVLPAKRNVASVGQWKIKWPLVFHTNTHSFPRQAAETCQTGVCVCICVLGIMVIFLASHRDSTQSGHPLSHFNLSHVLRDMSNLIQTITVTWLGHGYKWLRVATCDYRSVIYIECYGLSWMQWKYKNDIVVTNWGVVGHIQSLLKWQNLATFMPIGYLYWLAENGIQSKENM